MSHFMPEHLYSHQWFVIARVDGPGSTPRVIASANCRNKGDTEVVEACWRLLKIFSSPANRVGVRHDIAAAARKQPAWWSALDHRQTSLFAFTQTCLTLGITLDPSREEPAFYPVLRIPHTWNPENIVMNHNGCTIIDVSDSHPRYCFMFYPRDKASRSLLWPPSGTPEAAAVGKQCRKLRKRPLDAARYLSWPCLERHDMPDFDFSPWELVRAETLWMLWPRIQWPKRPRGFDGSTPPRRGSPSLMSLAFRKLLDGELDESHIASVDCIPGFHTRLRHLLQSSPYCHKRGGLALLQSSMAQDGEILDFSEYPWLSIEAIFSIMSALPDSQLGKVHTIDLSLVKSMSAGFLPIIAKFCPKLRTLHLMQLPKATMSIKSVVEHLYHAADGEDIQHDMKLPRTQPLNIQHTELFQRVFIRPDDVLPRSWRFGELPCEPGYLSAFGGTVTRLLYLSTRSAVTATPRLPNGGLDWHNLAWWAVDHYTTSVPLEDAFLDPRRITSWLPRLLWFLATNTATPSRRFPRGRYTAMGCACALALDVEDDWKVSPLPANAYHKSAGEPMLRRRHQDPLDESWTLVILTEEEATTSYRRKRCRALRYALARRDAGGSLAVHDISGFYKIVTGVKLPGLLPELPPMASVCHEEEIKAISASFLTLLASTENEQA